MRQLLPCCNYIQGHLTLEVINIVLEALSEHHLDHEEVIVVFLKLTSRSVLVVEDLPYLFEVLK